MTLTYSPGSTHRATAGADGTVQTFTLEMDDLITLARARLTRGLTDEECRWFLHTDTCP